MRNSTAFLFVMLLGTPFAVIAQGSDSRVAIIKHNWERVRLRETPSASSLASQDELIQQSRRQQQLATARNSNNPGAAARIETQINTHEQAKAKALENDRPQTAFRYKVKLQNNGQKTIKSIDWDYVFLDRLTNEELERHQFANDETIKPGRSKEVSVLYLKPPVRTITVGTLEQSRKMHDFIQRVEIARIQFSDGTIWQRP